MRLRNTPLAFGTGRLHACAARQERLSCHFNAVASGQLDDPALDQFVSTVLTSHGLAATLPLQSILDGLEPVHTGMIVNEAALMADLAEQGLLRTRLLLRSSRAIYCPPEDTSDTTYNKAVPAIVDDIKSTFEGLVPYAYQTAENFLTAAQSYPSAHAHADLADVIGHRRADIAREYQKLEDGMRASPLTPAQMDVFYAGYTDMSADPAADYARNTLDLADKHLSVADATMDRMTLRIAQAYLCLRDPAIVSVLQSDTAFRADFDTRLLETQNGFTRISLHLQGGQLTSAPLYGAAQLLQTAIHYAGFRPKP